MRSDCQDVCQGDVGVEENFGQCYVQQKKSSPWCCWICIIVEASISSLPPSAKNHGLNYWQNEWLFSPAAVTESQVQTLLSSLVLLA